MALEHTITAAKQDNWPEWLRVFDQQNNQHEATAKVLDDWFEKLGKNLPPAWEGKDTIKILELASGDGRLTHKMLETILKHTGKKIEYFGMELNPASVALANKELAKLKLAEKFPGRVQGKVIQADLSDGKGDIAEGNLQAKLPENFKPDFTIMSHAMYFAHDKAKFVQKVAELGHKNTVTMYIMNSALSKLVPDDMYAVTRTLVRSGLTVIEPKTFESSIGMPAKNAMAYLERLRTNPSLEGLDQSGKEMHSLLSFLGQKSFDSLGQEKRDALLDEIEGKLRHTGNNSLPLNNQVYFAFQQEVDRSMRSAFSNATVNVAPYFSMAG